MSRKDKKFHAKEQAAPASLPPAPLLSRRGLKVIGIGISLVVAGFVVLTFTDPRGQNWASILSPFLLVGGYSLVGIGIITSDPVDPA